jgi:hypothetical protein
MPGGDLESVGLRPGDEGDGEGIELGPRDLEVVAQGEVRILHESTEGSEI